ncbi:hypothetical protein [Streptomyces sp. NPDC050759]|uniref:hypothetical protein n=1 Tax=Streptomyces sp. NPDC050759 TaxID=3365635 RepID=UPI0037A960D8
MTSASVARPATASDHRVEILDCTLREGSYAVDFQLPAATIERVLIELEESGVHHIELGHGWGLNGHTMARPSLVPDEEAFRIAAQVVKKASWGAICVPGIASLEHVERAADAGIQFLRVGTNITEADTAPPFVERAKELGLRTSVNLMKTQVLDEDAVIETVKRCESYGADMVYLVDSYGSLLPEDARRFVARSQNSVGIPVGFHGHDNLGMAHANTLAAVEAGASLVDTTLDGMGRSAGNASTEAVSTLLRKLAIDPDIDSFRLASASEQLIQPLDRIADSRYYQLVGAYTDLHSSSFPMFTRVADEVGVDVAELMERVSAIDSVNPDAELARREALALRGAGTA